MNVPINLVNGDHCTSQRPTVGSVYLQNFQPGVWFVGEGNGGGGIISVDHHILHGVLVQQMVFWRCDFGDDVAARPRDLDGRKPVRIRGDVAHNAVFGVTHLKNRTFQ